MSATILLAGLLLTQTTASTVLPDDSVRTADAAYEAMAEGKTDEAIARLSAKADKHPATLINLGTAYARKGMWREARECFDAAMAADRVDLQLADGSWMDSRKAARIAAARLDSSTFAAR